MTRPPHTDGDDRPLCLAAAEHLLREREARYPGLVTRERLTAAAAAEGLERARCLVAQWRWIVDPTTPPLPAHDPDAGGPFGTWHRVLADELHDAATRAATIADRAPDDARLRQLAALYAALAWHQRPDDGSRDIVATVHQCRLATAEYRAREANPERIAA